MKHIHKAVLALCLLLLGAIAGAQPTKSAPFKATVVDGFCELGKVRVSVEDYYQSNASQREPFRSSTCVQKRVGESYAVGEEVLLQESNEGTFKVIYRYATRMH